MPIFNFSVNCVPFYRKWLDGEWFIHYRHCCIVFGWQPSDEHTTPSCSPSNQSSRTGKEVSSHDSTNQIIIAELILQWTFVFCDRLSQWWSGHGPKRQDRIEPVRCFCWHVPIICHEFHFRLDQSTQRMGWTHDEHDSRMNNHRELQESAYSLLICSQRLDFGHHMGLPREILDPLIINNTKVTIRTITGWFEINLPIIFCDLVVKVLKSVGHWIQEGKLRGNGQVVVLNQIDLVNDIRTRPIKEWMRTQILFQSL